MRTIWKFPMEITDEVTLEMPAGSEILSVGNQNGELCLWAVVNPQAGPSYRYFRVYETGHPVKEISQHMAFVGTVQFHGGQLIFHVFEIFGE